MDFSYFTTVKVQTRLRTYVVKKYQKMQMVFDWSLLDEVLLMYDLKAYFQ